MSRERALVAQTADTLAERGFDVRLIAVVTRVKRHNFFHSIYSPMIRGVLAMKDSVISFFPIKDGQVDYANPHSFAPTDVVPPRCSLSRGMGRGVLEIKYADKRKDEFHYNTYFYYNTLSEMCGCFFKQHIA